MLVFLSFVFVERRGLGIGHGFYIAILLAAMSGGPVTGTVAGLLATVLYAVGVIVNPHIPPADLPTLATAIRMVCYVSVGGIVGYYASVNRRLMGGAYDLVDELTILAKRDSVTGLPNTRAFEAAATRRLTDERPFAMLVGEAAAVVGGDALRDLGDRLSKHLLPGDEIARVGASQFAVLAACATADDAAGMSVRLERVLESDGIRVTFGWATYPRDGDNALSLFRAADERLHARKIVRGEWKPAAEAEGLRAVGP